MQSYLEASLSFLESKEMRDYLREKLPEFRWVALGCADIVAYAPASIERKLPVLEKIAQEAEPELAFDGEPFTAYAVRFAQCCRTALDERYSGPEGVVFWLEASSYDGDESCLFDDALFTGFDAVLNYLKKLSEEYPQESAFEGLSYTITKYLPADNGQLDEYCIWYLNNSLEPWYFDYLNFPDGWEKILYHDLNLPVPFQPGDIVLADCRPYARPRRVLILDVGDNIDCCCLQALYIGEDGQLFAGAFKHNDFLFNSDSFSPISGLYRACRWTAKPAACEEPFAVLSPLIYKRPGLGIEIRDYIWEKGIDGRPWTEVKGSFGL